MELFTKEQKNELIGLLGWEVGNVYIDWYERIVDESLIQYYGDDLYTYEDIEADEVELMDLIKSNVSEVIGREED